MTELKILFGADEPATRRPLPDLDRLEEEFNRADTDWTIPEAFFCLLLEAAFADGEIADEEQAEIAALVRRSRTMKRLNGQQIAAVNQTVNERMKERRETGLQEACAVLPRDMRLSVYAHCLDIVLADRIVRDSEEEYLQKIAGYMGLDEESVRVIRKVMYIKNSY